MDSSPLNRLAPELRNEIYELVLTAPGPISGKYSHKDDAWVFDANFKRRNLLAITQTCKKIHTESKEMVYALNDFEIKIGSNDPPRLWSLFISRFSLRHANLMRSITFDVGEIETHWPRMYATNASLAGMITGNMAYALYGCRLVSAESERHFNLKLTFPRLAEIRVKLSAEDLAQAWDEKVAQQIPDDGFDGWTAERDRAIEYMRACRIEHEKYWAHHEEGAIIRARRCRKSAFLGE